MKVSADMLSLTGAISSLASNSAVQAVLQIGSLRQQQLTPDSDYDLVIVLEDLDEPWFVGVTELDGRFTDLIFVNQPEIDKVNNLETAVSYLQQHDPAFLTHYQAFITSAIPAEKFCHYQTAAAIAAEPWGGLWKEAPSLTNRKREADLWQRLIDHDVCSLFREKGSFSRSTEHLSK